MTGEADLAGADAELGDVGDPQPVGRSGVETAIDKVGGRGVCVQLEIAVLVM